MKNKNEPCENYWTLNYSLWQIKQCLQMFFYHSRRQPKSLSTIIESAEVLLGMVKTAKRKVKFWRLNVELQIGVKCKREGSNYVVASAFKADSQAHTSIGVN